MQEAIFCENTAPDLYSFTYFLMVIYGLFFFIGLIYIFFKAFGQSLKKMAKDTVEPTVVDAADNIFKAKYVKYDPKISAREITKEDLSKLLKDLGVFVPAEELEALKATFDPDETGMCQYALIRGWFLEMNAELEDEDDLSEDSDEPFDAEVAKIEKEMKAKRKAKKNAEAKKSKRS